MACVQAHTHPPRFAYIAEDGGEVFEPVTDATALPGRFVAQLNRRLALWLQAAWEGPFGGFGMCRSGQFPRRAASFSSMAICGVVLAAGRSARMGTPKALLDFRGEPFVLRILEVLEAVDLKPRLVVLGPDAPRIRPFLAPRKCVILENPEIEGGPIVSVRCALTALPCGHAHLAGRSPPHPGLYRRAAASSLSALSRPGHAPRIRRAPRSSRDLGLIALCRA